jgi:hypothetical protein
MKKNSTTVYYIHIGLYGHPFTGKRFIADLVVSKLTPFRNSWPPPTLRDVSARMVKSKLEVAASREPVFFKGLVYRKPPYLMGKSMVSGEDFPNKTI